MSDKRTVLSVRCHGDDDHTIILPVRDTSQLITQLVCKVNYAQNGFITKILYMLSQEGTKFNGDGHG